jgi:hypothetical protein
MAITVEQRSKIALLAARTYPELIHKSEEFTRQINKYVTNSGYRNLDDISFRTYCMYVEAAIEDVLHISFVGLPINVLERIHKIGTVINFETDNVEFD